VEKIQEINEKVLNCKKCSLHKIIFNDNSKSELGYGKLLAKENKETKIMVVGLNPSRNRFSGLKHAFSGGEYFKEDKSGWMFCEILKNFGIFDKCFITNIVKCSTATNKISEKDLQNCYENFLDELEYCKPELILFVGTQVYDFLVYKNINDLNRKYKIAKIHHPSYCLAYKRITLEQYIEQIESVLKINFFI
jgi:uracil-DNA glycosylase family 4